MPATGAEHVHDALRAAGVEVLFEVPGHQTIPVLDQVEDRGEIRRIRARHETAIPHMAWGHYEAGGPPAATMSVPGPGDTNAMHGLRNALDDRVPMIHLTADVDPSRRGQGAIHEFEPEALDPAVKVNEVVTNPESLPGALARGIAESTTRPTGPVRFSIPAGYLSREIDGAGIQYTPERTDYDPQDAYDRAAAMLAEAERPVVHVDNGARRSPGATAAIRALVADLNLPVFSSYKGYGIVPSDDDHYMSPPGLAVLPGAIAALDRADVVLSLGGYFDGPGTGMWTVPMGESIIHVTDEPARIDASYEAALPVVADVADATREIHERVEGPVGWDGARIGRQIRREYDERLAEAGLLEDRSPASTPAVFHTLREALPDDTTVVIDIGHFRTWALTTFDVREPEHIITPGSWTGMGVGIPGAIGAKLAHPDRPAVNFIGDGCLMMCLQELHTAAEHDVDITTVVFNNADYSIISTEAHLRATRGDRFYEWDSPDFVALAEALGCGGTRAESPGEVADAVEAALETDRPELLDVIIDPAEPSPTDVVDFETTVDFA